MTITLNKRSLWKIFVGVICLLAAVLVAQSYFAPPPYKGSLQIMKDGSVIGLAFSPNGQMFATYSFYPAGAPRPGTYNLSLWNAHSGKLIRVLDEYRSPAWLFGGYLPIKSLSFVDFSNRGDAIFENSCPEGAIKEWNVSDGVLLRRIDNAQALRSRSELLFVSLSHKMGFLKATSPALSVPLATKPGGWYLDSLDAVRPSPDSHSIELLPPRVAEGMKAMVDTYDEKGYRSSNRLAISDPLYYGQFSKDGKLVAGISVSGLAVLSTTNGKVVWSRAVPHILNAIIVSNTGNLVAVCGSGGYVAVFDLASGREIFKDSLGPSNTLSSVAFDESHHRIAVGTLDGYVIFRNY
jgi:WD40 repeat protein